MTVQLTINIWEAISCKYYYCNILFMMKMLWL